MPSFVCNRVHCVFPTRERIAYLKSQIRPRLGLYLTATAQKLGVEIIAVGCVADHVHIWIALPAKISLAEVIQKIKLNTSRWIRTTFQISGFSWQQGYGAFSISVSSTEAVVSYIRSQKEHHKARDYREELAQMLRQSGVEPRDLPSYGLD